MTNSERSNINSFVEIMRKRKEVLEKAKISKARLRKSKECSSMSKVKDISEYFTKTVRNNEELDEVKGRGLLQTTPVELFKSEEEV